MENNKKYKGIHQKKNTNKFEAYLMVKNAGGKSRKRFKAYIGIYDTKDEAASARLQFINNLK